MVVGVVFAVLVVVLISPVVEVVVVVGVAAAAVVVVVLVGTSNIVGTFASINHTLGRSSQIRTSLSLSISDRD